MKFLPFLPALFLACSLHAQGLILDDEHYEQLPRQPLYGDGGKSEATALEGVFKVDLRPFCPKPRNQGNISSCTGWATGYAAMSISYAVKNGWENDRKTATDSAFSSLFLYNQVRSDTADCMEGSHIDAALRFLEDNGNVRSRDYDIKVTACKRKPTPEEKEWAKAYRIKDWMRLFGSKDPSRVKIDKTKLSLAAHKPVIVGMKLRNNFLKLNTDNKYWLPMLGDTTQAFAHAMTVVGFDDGKGAFEVMNSWGETWGNGGFCWVKYDDYARHVFYAFEMTLGDKPKINPKVPVEAADKTLFGTALIRFPKEIVGTNIQFEDAPFLFKNGLYELSGEETAWPVGKLFQLVVSDVEAGSYLYAFSFDAKGAIKVHWPRDGQLDAKFEGLNESAVITNSKVKVIVPEELSALRLEEPGTEHICLLFSREPLRDFNTLLQQIQSGTGAFPDRLKKALGTRVVPAAQVKYSGTSVAFDTYSVKGLVVPVMLKIPVRQ